MATNGVKFCKYLILEALNGSTGFLLELNVQNNASRWAAVIDYATINLNYEPGAPNPTNNPVPEPATLLLVGSGLAGLAAARRRKKNKQTKIESSRSFSSP